MPSFLYRFQHIFSAQSLIWIVEGSSVSTLQGPGEAHGSVEQSQNFENSGWPECGLHFEGILAGWQWASPSCDEQNRPKPVAVSSWCSMCLMPVWHDTHNANYFKALATCWKMRGSLSPVRHWQKDWSTTRPWQTWICSQIRLAVKGLRLGVWRGWWGSWEIGQEGR